MKNFIPINDNDLSFVWGGTDSGPAERAAAAERGNILNHGKTQPGGNEDIFSRDRLAG
jgi:hypothetical protein